MHFRDGALSGHCETDGNVEMPGSATAANGDASTNGCLSRCIWMNSKGCFHRAGAAARRALTQFTLSTGSAALHICPNSRVPSALTLRLSDSLCMHFGRGTQC